MFGGIVEVMHNGRDVIENRLAGRVHGFLNEVSGPLCLYSHGRNADDFQSTEWKKATHRR